MKKANDISLVSQVALTIEQRGLSIADAPVLLMVSGGSDSCALAYIAAQLRDVGVLGEIAILHVNHMLRGKDADDDATFVEELAQLLDIPFFLRRVDVASIAQRERDNVEAVARRVRYIAAREVLHDLSARAGVIFTAHTADDRVENFYMRSIVGTGPGGFRSMRYLNGDIARPLLDLGRTDLRAYIENRVAQGLPVARDAEGHLWREDATNAQTDLFRGYVRHEIVPLAKERNARLADTLTRTMNLIADEDDYLEGAAQEIAAHMLVWESERTRGFVLLPAFGAEPLVLRRRVCFSALGELMSAGAPHGVDVRVENAAVNAVLEAFLPDGYPKSGYVTNIQGNLAVSANKRGVRVEPMSAFRARRKRV